MILVLIAVYIFKLGEKLNMNDIYIIKRNGDKVLFDPQKIINAIYHAWL